MKKICVWLMAVAMCTSVLFGCSAASQNASTTTATETTAAAAETTETAAEEAPAAEAAAAPEVAKEAAEDVDTSTVDYSNMKVGMLCNQSATDGGWTQAHVTSIYRAFENLGMDVESQLIVMEGLSDAGPEAAAAVGLLADEGCNLIIGSSSGFSSAIGDGAKTYPDIIFYQFEGSYDTNYASYSINDPEAIFLLGYASALMSEGDALGFVASQPQASVVRAVNSFAAGAKYANPEATVKVMWTNSWYDPAKEKESANAMIDAGITAMGYHGSTPSVAEATSAAGVYSTGYHIDMNSYAPDSILTSFIWNWTPIFETMITTIADGSWTNATLFYGVETGSASISGWNADIMPAEVIAQCEEVEALVMGGEVQAFVGPVMDNQGNVMLEEGETFSDAELMGMMFLLDNVIGELP